MTFETLTIEQIWMIGFGVISVLLFFIWITLLSHGDKLKLILNKNHDIWNVNSGILDNTFKTYLNTHDSVNKLEIQINQISVLKDKVSLQYKQLQKIEDEIIRSSPLELKQ